MQEISSKAQGLQKWMNIYGLELSMVHNEGEVRTLQRRYSCQKIDLLVSCARRAKYDQ